MPIKDNLFGLVVPLIIWLFIPIFTDFSWSYYAYMALAYIIISCILVTIKERG